MEITKPLFYLITFLLITLPFLGYTKFSHWFFRIFDFIKVQISIIQLIFLGVIYFTQEPFATTDYVAMALLGFSALLNMSYVVPYTFLYPEEVEMIQESRYGEEFSLITANVLQHNDNYEDFVGFVKSHQPDFVLTMEVDKKWDEGLKPIEEDYPHTVKATLDNLYGMHLYSKHEIEDESIEYLVEDDIPSIHCKLNFSDRTKVWLNGVHPAPPSPSENETSEERDAELMIVGKRVAEQDETMVVCGDLNDVAWSKTSRLFKKMSGLLDPRIGRWMYPTFHAKYFFLRFPLDHLFHSKDMKIKKIERLPYYGSDHFAMYYEFIIKPYDATKKHNEELTDQEKEDVEEFIEEGTNKPENTKS